MNAGHKLDYTNFDSGFLDILDETAKRPSKSETFRVINVFAHLELNDISLPIFQHSAIFILTAPDSIVTLILL